ncbi:MAG: NAD-binding protein [Caldilineaceae bacterium]|nr:NAD-binding protein [Caldilineaceae bacterium]
MTPSQPASQPHAGFIGLGAMGSGMASSLLRAGIAVRGYDVNPLAIQRLLDMGGAAASSPAGAADGADTLLLMVLNGEQADESLFGENGAVAALAPGALVILCSTVAPSYVRTLAQRLAAHTILFVDAPVSGGTARAAEGKLSIMASGSPAAFARATPYLAAMAENLYPMGDEPGQGSTMKLVNQVLAGIQIAAAAEAIAFGSKAGIDPNRIFEVISNSAGASWVFQNRVPHILADDFTPHSAIDIWLKDLDLVLDTGKEMRLPTPLAAVAHQLYVMAAASGYGRLDDSAVIKVFEKLAGFRVLDAVAPEQATSSADNSSQ